MFYGQHPVQECLRGTSGRTSEPRDSEGEDAAILATSVPPEDRKREDAAMLATSVPPEDRKGEDAAILATAVPPLDREGEVSPRRAPSQLSAISL